MPSEEWTMSEPKRDDELLEQIHRTGVEALGRAMRADIIGGFQYADQRCKGCGKPLIIENAWMTDGCPCNSALGINSMNEMRWRLLMQLQQREAHAHQQAMQEAQEEIETLKGSEDYYKSLSETCRNAFSEQVADTRKIEAERDQQAQAMQALEAGMKSLEAEVRYELNMRLGLEAGVNRLQAQLLAAQKNENDAIEEAKKQCDAKHRLQAEVDALNAQFSLEREWHDTGLKALEGQLAAQRAEIERLKALPKPEDCLFHRCSKHYAEKQLNCTEISGAECGACVGEYEREHQRTLIDGLVAALEMILPWAPSCKKGGCGNCLACQAKPALAQANAALAAKEGE